MKFSYSFATLRDLFRTAEGADDDADDKQAGEVEYDEDTASWSKSNLVVCFKSCFPNHFANIDSHVLDHTQSC